ncbi:uracil-DNA glycosylase [uncultured Sphingomonas sp.]|uniref:uracil-DNA glycosylase n=1 Tax=uncultured Sphingomonas sp. TaxID=158754 RepID=UPI0035CA4CC5
MGVAPDFSGPMLEATLDWWREAGVDVLVEDAPRNWFAQAVPSPAVPAVDADTSGLLPDNLDAFLAWRGGEHAPEAQWVGPGVLASGPADAAVMILVDVPDRDDCSAGKLLTGEPGRLFDRMLAAIGLTREAVHLVSVCSKRPASGRVGRADEARLGEVARRHVELVAPKRLMVMGDAASRAVLGMNVLQARGRSHPLNREDGTGEVVASFHPRFLLEHPGRKREAWVDLRMLIRGIAE